MPIIRRQLKPSDVYPDNLRYDADTDTVQSFVNGEWVDSPEADPRTQTTLPPRATADPACDAAQSVVDALKSKIDDILPAIDGAATVFTIAGIILSIFTLGAFAVFVTLALGIGNAMLDAGTASLSAALTDPVYDTLKCILRCHMTSAGRLNPGELPVVEGEVGSQIGGLGAAILNSMLALAGEGGINNLASLGTSTGDCSDCDCVEPCATAVLQGFEFGVDIVYDVNESSGVTTATGSSGLAGDLDVVRWGFYADSTPDGCHFNAITLVDAVNPSFYYREVGEPDSTVHGPMTYAELVTEAGPLCLNLIQFNSDVPFTFALYFRAC